MQGSYITDGGNAGQQRPYQAQAVADDVCFALLVVVMVTHYLRFPTFQEASGGQRTRYSDDSREYLIRNVYHKLNG